MTLVNLVRRLVMPNVKLAKKVTHIWDWVSTEYPYKTVEASYNLLLSHLPKEEHHHLKKNRQINVVGSHSGLVYTIETEAHTFQTYCKNYPYGIHEKTYFCLLGKDCPYYDTILAHYLLIKYDEVSYLKESNWAGRPYWLSNGGFIRRIRDEAVS